MSVDPKTKEWIELGTFFESLGLTPTEIRRKMMTKNQPSQVANSQQNSNSPPDDNFFADFMQMQKQAMKMKMQMELMRQYGLMGNEHDGKAQSTDDTKKLIEELRNGSNKFTKDDIMTIMMMRMLQSTEGAKGPQMSDMIQLMTMMNNKNTTTQEILTFLQALESKKQEGLHEGQQIATQIYTNPKPETFADFMDSTVQTKLKEAVEAKIGEIFTNPTQSGIMNDKGQFDWTKIANEVVKLGKQALEKMPAPQSPPNPSIQAEPPPESMEEGATPLIGNQPNPPPNPQGEMVEAVQ